MNNLINPSSGSKQLYLDQEHVLQDKNLHNLRKTNNKKCRFKITVKENLD